MPGSAIPRPALTIDPKRHPSTPRPSLRAGQGRALDSADALALHERNWRFVDEAPPPEEECAAISRLAADHGGGVFMPS
ncbi:MAG: hypothetical protein ACE37J_18090 [Pikeienuella sp.]|uniref:hypothetical protein n=1 Tax=Pikeienuella sp. TaxID=2831957 RepID=UPI00391B83F0